MKHLTSLGAVALLAIAGCSTVSAQIVDFYFNGTASDETTSFTKTFTTATFDPSFLNSTLSATLTSAPTTGTASSGTITANVFLANTADSGSSPTFVGNETLTLNLETTTSTSSTTMTPGYPTEFQQGPDGTFNEVIVEVTSSGLNDAIVSFTGVAEISAVPEPSTWAMMLAGVGILGFLVRRRGSANL